MRFGVYLPPFAEYAEPELVAALAGSAEDAGWDGFFLWDHMLAKPGMAVADAWVTMAAIAADTSAIRLGALVTPLPRRRPWVLSRQMATLDRLSNGRLIGGIGLGDDGWSEFSAFGEEVDPVVRGQMLDEALELLQRFLTGEPVDFTGHHYVVNAPPLLPTPQQSPLPIWGACRWPNRKPLPRIAKLQGCFPIFRTTGGPIPPPDPADIRELRAALTALGAPSTIDIAVRCALADEDPGVASDIASELEESGVTWVLESFPPGEPADRVADVIDRGPSARLPMR